MNVEQQQNKCVIEQKKKASLGVTGHVIAQESPSLFSGTDLDSKISFVQALVLAKANLEPKNHHLKSIWKRPDQLNNEAFRVIQKDAQFTGESDIEQLIGKDYFHKDYEKLDSHFKNPYHFNDVIHYGDRHGRIMGLNIHVLKHDVICNKFIESGSLVSFFNSHIQPSLP